VNRPEASNLNFVRGQTIANMVIAKVGVAGNVRLYNHLGATDVVVDVTGYVPESDGYVALAPARVLETRPGLPTIDGLWRPSAPVGRDSSINVQLAGRAGVPAANVAAVVLNVTATNPTAFSFVTVWPTGEPRPTASNLNVDPGQTVPNLVVAKLGLAGNVSIYNMNGSVDLIADVMGYFPTNGTYVPMHPARLLDTRPGYPQARDTSPADPIGPDGTIDMRVLGVGDVPPEGVSAVVLNVTDIESTAPSFLTVWPTGGPRPTASNLNVPGGHAVVPNMVVVGVGAGGKVSIYNHAGTAHLAVDVAGYFIEEPTDVRWVEPADLSTCLVDWLGRQMCWGQTPQDPVTVYDTLDWFGPRTRPYRLGAFRDAIEIVAGSSHSCVLRASGEVWCWATSPAAVIDGVVPYAGGTAPAWPPRRIEGLGPARAIASGPSETCVVLQDFTVWCWGRDVENVVHRTPHQLPGLNDAIALSSGGRTSCALRLTGQVACWGEGTHGNLGDGQGTDSPWPVDVAGLTDADGVIVSAGRGCATRETGEAVCWGESYLGDGSAAGSLTPVPVIDAYTGEPATDIFWIATGRDFGCALRIDAKVYCWGLDPSGLPGMVGDPPPPTALTDPVADLPPAELLVAGWRHVCAVSDQSAVYCWGNNDFGQLGDGTFGSRRSPTLVYDPYA
jgi:alpha-tubulin suppressor-like RCC1 family protein